MKNKLFVKKTLIVATVFVVIIVLLRCINEDPYDFHYDKDERKLSFILKNEGNIEVDIYWNDTLIASPKVEYNKDDKRYHVDVFPNHLIGGENAKPYLLDMCYEYSKENKLPLRYVVSYYDWEKDLFESKVIF